MLRSLEPEDSHGPDHDDRIRYTKNFPSDALADSRRFRILFAIAVATTAVIATAIRVAVAVSTITGIATAVTTINAVGLIGTAGPSRRS